MARILVGSSKNVGPVNKNWQYRRAALHAIGKLLCGSPLSTSHKEQDGCPYRAPGPFGWRSRNELLRRDSNLTDRVGGTLLALCTGAAVERGGVLEVETLWERVSFFVEAAFYFSAAEMESDGGLDLSMIL